MAVLQRLILCALTHKRKGMDTAPLRYAYIAPTRDQAADIAFGYLVNFTKQIPGVEVNRADLKVTFPSGAQIRLYSGESYERMRGLYFDGVVSDEDDDIPPKAFQFVILPCLLDYRGWHVRMGTPKGRSSLYRALSKAKTDPKDRFSLLLKASESGLISDEDLEAIRIEVGEDAYRQEMECDFDVARPGAIYASYIDRARSDGRICEIPVDDRQLVYTTWDLGSPENTVVCYWQRSDLMHKLIDCDYNLPMTTAQRVAHMLDKGYNYGQHFLPHDGASRGADNMSFQAKLQEAGLQRVEVLPNAGRNAEFKRIQSMHDLFSQIWINKDLDQDDGLINALSHYHTTEEKSSGKTTNNILHDYSSHFADSFGYWGEALLTGRVIGSMTQRAVGKARASLGNSMRA